MLEPYRCNTTPKNSVQYLGANLGTQHPNLGCCPIFNSYELSPQSSSSNLRYFARSFQHLLSRSLRPKPQSPHDFWAIQPLIKYNFLLSLVPSHEQFLLIWSNLAPTALGFLNYDMILQKFRHGSLNQGGFPPKERYCLFHTDNFLTNFLIIGPQSAFDLSLTSIGSQRYMIGSLPTLQWILSARFG